MEKRKLFFTTGCQEWIFMVEILRNRINIYKRDEDISDDEYDNIFRKFDPKKWASKYTKCVYAIGNYDKVFIPDGSKNSDRVYKGDPQYIGNSILIKVKNDKYIIITNTILRFELGNDEICEFDSPIIANDCNNPVGIGKKNIYSFDSHNILYKKMDKNSDNYWENKNKEKELAYEEINVENQSEDNSGDE